MVFKATFRWAKFWPFLSVPNIFSSRILQRRNKVKWKNKIKISAARPWSLFISHGFQNIFFLLFFFCLSSFQLLALAWHLSDGLRVLTPMEDPVLPFVRTRMGILCLVTLCPRNYRDPVLSHSLFFTLTEAAAVSHIVFTRTGSLDVLFFILKWVPFVTLCLHTDIKTFGWDVLNTK